MDPTQPGCAPAPGNEFRGVPVAKVPPVDETGPWTGLDYGSYRHKTRHQAVKTSAPGKQMSRCTVPMYLHCTRRAMALRGTRDGLPLYRTRYQEYKAPAPGKTNVTACHVQSIECPYAPWMLRDTGRVDCRAQGVRQWSMRIRIVGYTRVVLCATRNGAEVSDLPLWRADVGVLYAVGLWCWRRTEAQSRRSGSGFIRRSSVVILGCGGGSTGSDCRIWQFTCRAFDGIFVGTR